MFTKTIDWQEPLKLSENISKNSNYTQNWILLYSGLDLTNNSRSYLALYPQKEIISENFDELEKELPKQQKWFGYLSYNLKNYLEELPEDQEGFLKLPNLWMINFGLILEFDHKNKKIICFYSKEELFHKIPSLFASIRDGKGGDKFKIDQLKANYNKKEYLQKLSSIQERIKNGDLYQANLTRKFFGEFTELPTNNFNLFLELNKASPANYSCFIQLKKNSIISSSPELFLSIDDNGKCLSSPIKGTSPRDEDPKIDLAHKEYLKNSPKERAENLMIVDLVRNDLSKNCLPNSIIVKKLFEINSYKNVHHMSSDICGIKEQKYSSLDLIKNCFPPASMTGTPKIKAMEVCSKLEKDQRGVYSGAIGFLDKNTCHLSVVIRTLLIQKNKFEFQVGGAITHDSEPKKEWEETINKAKGIAKILNIDPNLLKEI